MAAQTCAKDSAKPSPELVGVSDRARRRRRVHLVPPRSSSVRYRPAASSPASRSSPDPEGQAIADLTKRVAELEGIVRSIAEDKVRT